MDSFTEVSHQGWLSRLGGSCAGVLVGLVLTVAAPVLLFWNEGRSVKRARDLAQGRDMVVEGKAEAVDRALEGKLVHVSGRATTDDVLEDPEFGVRVNAVSLERRVEMYQWKEEKHTRTRKNLGGSETKETTYEYEKTWSDHPISSSGFRHREGHENPGRFPVEHLSVHARLVQLGAYRLSDAQVREFGGFTPLGGSDLPGPGAGRHAIPGGYYLGPNPGSPEIGDVRVTFKAAYPADVSVIAQQTGDTFRPLAMETGNTLSRLEMGLVSAEAMFAHAEAENAALTWGLRLLGFFLMGIGISLIFRPLSVAADVVPFVGNLVGMGTGCAAFGLAAVGSLVTIGVGWVAWRPLVGIPLLALGGGGLVALIVMGAKAKARRAAA